MIDKRVSCAFVIGVVFSIATSVFAAPEELTEPDRAALLDRLEAIQKRADDRVNSLYKRAVFDFRRAVSSDDATMDLYLKCYKKLNFEDRNKKAKDFRLWKRNNKDRLKSSSMRMALRYQLSWLLLSIEAAQMDGDVTSLANKAKDHIAQILRHAKALKGSQNILRQNALGSIFTQAYKLNIKVNQWPRSTLDIEGVYDRIVLPPFRDTKNVAALRSAWNERISQQKGFLEAWTEKPKKRIGMKKNLRSSEYQKFISETLPTLLWRMEVDCFKAGDERASALKMLKYLESNMNHKNKASRMKQFHALIYKR